MGAGIVSKIRLGAATTGGAPKKPSIPSAKSVSPKTKSTGVAGKSGG